MNKKKKNSYSDINIAVLVSDESYGLDLYEGYWNPLFFFGEKLKNLRINLNIIYKLDKRVFKNDIVILSSRYFKKKNNIIDECYFSLFESLSKKKIRIIWFDLRDSAGTTQFEVLPYVDLYYKKQIYKNKKIYYKDIYGGRDYSNFYHKKFHVSDDNPYNFIKLEKKYESKINISWNIGVKLFSPNYKNFFQRAYALSKYKFQKTLNSLSYEKPFFTVPESPRQIDFISTYSTEIPRNSVRFQRQLFKKKNYQINNSILFKKINPSKYLNFLKKCKVILSLYGWGEVCYKEFEATVAGATFIMPNMSNILTWPNIYIPGKTYLPIDWDLENFEEIYYKILNDTKMRLSLVKNAQNILKSIHEEKGEQYFKSIFTKITDIGK